MIGLMITLVVDTSIIKVYDLIDKDFLPEQGKILLFSVNSSLCLSIEFIIINYVKRSFKRNQLKGRLNIETFFRVSFISLIKLGSLIGFMIFQQLYNSIYSISISILIVAISYGVASCFIVRLAMLFFSWYKLNHDLIVFLYFVSMSLIAFHLVMTAAITGIKMDDRPDEIRNFVGGSVDISVGRYLLLDVVYTTSSVVSFISMWITTALLMNYYRDELIVNAIVYWIILAVPLGYFLINYFYQFVFANLLISYLMVDPVTVSIVLTAFLSLSKPLGGLTFAISFWNTSRIVSYEKNIKTYMIISGWGILLLFGANQGVAQTLGPYPPFGLATVTVLTTGAFLMLIGIYNSATYVSVNDNLRKSIHRRAAESKLLHQIGQAEMENEIQKSVKEITRAKDNLQISSEAPVELDQKELVKYLDQVIREVMKEDKD
jgi:hypothetical protein